MALFYNKKYITELGVQGGNQKKDDDNTEDTNTDDTTTDDTNDDELESEPDTTDDTNDDELESEPDTGDNTNMDDSTTDDNELESEPDTGDDTNDDDNTSGGTDSTPTPDTTTSDTSDGDTSTTDDDNLEEPDTGDEGSEGGETDDTESEENTDDENISDEDPISQEKLKGMEDEIFSSLSEPQKLIKISELKGSYSRLYRSCDDILTNIDNIPKSDENLLVMERVTSTLSDLKVYIEHYLMYTFDTKTYTENETNLQKYISIFNAVKDIFREINKQKR